MSDSIIGRYCRALNSNVKEVSVITVEGKAVEIRQYANDCVSYHCGMKSAYVGSSFIDFFDPSYITVVYSGNVSRYAGLQLVTRGHNAAFAGRVADAGNGWCRIR